MQKIENPSAALIIFLKHFLSFFSYFLFVHLLIVVAKIKLPLHSNLYCNLADFQVLDVKYPMGKLSVVVSKIHSKALYTVTTVNPYGMNLFTSNWTQRVIQLHI